MSDLPQRRRRGPTTHFKRLDISASAMATFASGGPADDALFYAAMAVLADTFPLRQSKMAFFPPSLIAAWRQNSPISTLMSSIVFTEFWTRKVTVVPVHGPGHWSVAFVYPRHRRIEIFDSLCDATESRALGEVRNER